MSLDDVVADMREYATLARDDEPKAICAHILDYANVIAAEPNPAQPTHPVQARPTQHDSDLSL